MKNNVFLDGFTNNSRINSIRSKIENFFDKNNIIKKFSSSIEEFIVKNEINLDLISEEVVFQYWLSLLNVYLHDEDKTKWSEQTLNNYLICITRLQEFLIYICTLEDDNLSKIFVDEKYQFIDCYYFYIKDHVHKIKKEKYFHIKKIKSKNLIILEYNDKNDYHNAKHYYSSTINVQPFKKENILILDHFFKLDDYYVNEIFNLASSRNIIQGRNSKGLLGPRIPFEVYENVNLSRIPLNELDKELSEESIKENQLRINKAQSIIFDKNHSDLINKDFYDIAVKNDLSSRYKRFQISKAISNSITKRNLNLQSDYNLPEFEVFKEFFLKIKEKSISSNSIENILFISIIELSFFTALEIKKLILVLLGIDSQISYKVKESILKININKKVFASAIVEEEFSENTKNQTCEIYLPYDITILWTSTSNTLKRIFYENFTNKTWLENININKKSLSNEDNANDDFENNISIEYFYKFVEDYRQNKEYYKLEFIEFISIFKKLHTNSQIKEIEKLQIVDTFLDELYIKIDHYLDHELKTKENRKRIVLSLHSINRLFLQYFRKYNNCSELNLLFSQSISKNDEARLCYNTEKDRLVTFENAMKDLYTKIYGKKPDVKEQIISNKFWVGSPFYIKPGSFKNFIFEITKIKSDDKIITFNLNMIFIRYGLSILLGTRDYKNSSNLTQYSEELKILLIQEKAKNLYSSKRIIPLCNLALKLISIFNIIKNEYNISSNYPVLINSDQKEEDLNKNNINKFLDSLDEEIYKKSKDYIKKFIENTKLNYGRHVTTSYLSSSSLESNYLDAFLNHFKMGKEDQGIYSNFYNLDYIEKIVKRLDEISDLYFPNNIKIGTYEYR